MRRLLLALLLLFALLAIAPAEEAGAHYQPPGQWHRDYPNCVHDGIYGNYGNGFAQMKLIGSNCSGYSSVGVITAHDGHTHVAWCSLLAAIFNPTPSCWWGGDTNTVVTVAVHGTAISMAVNACYDSGGSPHCVRLDNGIFMPNNGLHTPPQF